MRSIKIPLFIYIVFNSIIIFAQDGVPDINFGELGFYRTQSLNCSDNFSCLAIQKDRKIVVAGMHYDGNAHQYSIMVEQLTEDGHPNPNFHHNSPYIFSGDYYWPWVGALAIQSDGSIFVAGNFNENSMVLIKLNVDGFPDASFGNNGIVEQFVSPGSFGVTDIGFFSDGKIFVSTNQTSGLYYGITLFRFLPDGTPDVSFADNGMLYQPQHDYCPSMLITSDDKILLSGNFGLDIYKLNNDGSADSTFGINGFASFTPGINCTASDIVILPDRSIVACGYISNSSYQIVIGKYNEDGSVDNSFGSGGYTIAHDGTTYLNNFARAIAVQADGKLVVAGDYATFDSNSDFLLARFTPDGKIDSTFNGTGFSGYTYKNYTHDFYAMEFSPDGGIIASGVDWYRGVVARYNSGTLQSSLPENEEIKLYPNPNDGFATLEYKLENSGYVSIYLFNIHGEKISNICDHELQDTGLHGQLIKVPFTAAPGIYFVRLFTDDGFIDVTMVKDY